MSDHVKPHEHDERTATPGPTGTGRRVIHSDEFRREAARPRPREEESILESMSRELKERIADRTARIGVIGQGYVGLPLARTFNDAGFSVTGFDLDSDKVESLNQGKSYIKTVGGDAVAAMVDSGRFRATTEFRELRQLDVVVICVPTPLTKTREPDLSHVTFTANQIRKFLERGQLIVLESTTYPGTTREVVLPILEESGLTAGQDFFLAFSPEREDPGNKKFETRTIPKLVGGIDETSGKVAAHFYSSAFQQVVEVSDSSVAEAAKVLENIYRAVNIALVNELKVLFDRMDIDIWEVIAAAKTKPFGFQAFSPGPGLGGHCIPIDPFYLTWKAREYDLSTRFIELAGEINTGMPRFVIQKVAEALNAVETTIKGSRGLIIGVAYKPNTDDTRESPAFRLIELLDELGASLSYHDPHVPSLPCTRSFQKELTSVELTPELLSQSDFTLIVTDHEAIDWDLVVEHSRIVVDTRNATRGVVSGRDKIVKA